MPLSMYQVSAPVYLQMLNAMLGWLDKAGAHAEAKKFDPNNFAGMRPHARHAAVRGADRGDLQNKRPFEDPRTRSRLGSKGCGGVSRARR
jgi:hypothetical protein